VRKTATAPRLVLLVTGRLHKLYRSWQSGHCAAAFLCAYVSTREHNN
jgi:hypothetical protein